MRLDDWRTPADDDMTPLGFLAAAFTFGLFFVAVLGVLITLWAAMVPVTVQ